MLLCKGCFHQVVLVSCSSAEETVRGQDSGQASNFESCPDFLVLGAGRCPSAEKTVRGQGFSSSGRPKRRSGSTRSFIPHSSKPRTSRRTSRPGAPSRRGAASAPTSRPEDRGAGRRALEERVPPVNLMQASCFFGGLGRRRAGSLQKDFF